MTISDAIPVQFWVNGVETFNQKEVCGITPACFCQPFESGDEIRIQLNDSEFNSFELNILDEFDNEVATLSFSEVSENIHELSFTNSGLGITGQVRLIIVGILNLSNENFTTSLDGWENYLFSGINDWEWADDGGNGSANSNTIGTNTGYLRQGVVINDGDEIIITGEIRFQVASAGTSTVEIVAINSDGVQILQSITSASGTSSITVETTAENAKTHLGFRAISGTGEHQLFVHNFNVQVKTIVAYSDCLDIRTSHDCTQLIRYDNTKDFAGIEYSTFSPTAEFYLRIPAIFFHERNTEEEESFEESSENIVRLRNEIKLKRLLEVGFMPDYMHRKLLLILAHDTVEIDGESWIKRDPYEKEEPGNRRYPLKKASVLLTQKDYIKRNIL